jgi:protein-disulfide isomerase
VGKNRKAKEIRTVKKSGKAKYIILGIIAAVVAAGAYAAINNDTNSQNPQLSVDTSKGSPVLGLASAPVTIIEFGDYQCPFCQRWNINTKPLIEENYIDKGLVKLIYMDLTVVGPDSLKAHASSYCAEEQGLYWEYHDFLYKNQGHENDGWAKPANLKSLAIKMDGLDASAFAQCLDSGKYENRVRDNHGIATKFGARSTPSFLIIGPDGQAAQITGAHPYSTFESAINEMLPT